MKLLFGLQNWTMGDNLENAKKAARKAVEFDNGEQYKKALCYYDIAVRLLDKVSPTDSPVRSKGNEYRERILSLQARGKFIK